MVVIRTLRSCRPLCVMIAMNRISTLKITGEFDPYLQYAIDKAPLDNILDKECPENGILNLIPTLDRSLETKEERIIVWSRILPESGTSICPILMCEDDRDFYCLLIVVEIEVIENTVLWKRFGLDKSSPNNLSDVGTTVKWLDNSPSFMFEKTEYQLMIESFKKQYDADESELHKKGYT